MGAVIYVRRVGRHMKGECVRRLRRRATRI